MIFLTFITSQMARSTTNFACVLMKPMTVEVKEVPIPFLSKDDVKVRVESTGLCGTDVRSPRNARVRLTNSFQLTIYKNFGVGKELMTEPVVLGHESAGVVVEVGKNVQSVSVGDRVAIEPFFFCRKYYSFSPYTYDHTYASSRCNNCKIGRTNLCTTFRQAGFRDVQGSMSSFSRNCATFLRCSSVAILRLRCWISHKYTRFDKLGGGGMHPAFSCRCPPSATRTVLEVSNYRRIVSIRHSQWGKY